MRSSSEPISRIPSRSFVLLPRVPPDSGVDPRLSKSVSNCRRTCSCFSSRSRCLLSMAPVELFSSSASTNEGTPPRDSSRLLPNIDVRRSGVASSTTLFLRSTGASEMLLRCSRGLERLPLPPPSASASQSSVDRAPRRKPSPAARTTSSFSRSTTLTRRARRLTPGVLLVLGARGSALAVSALSTSSLTGCKDGGSFILLRRPRVRVDPDAGEPPPTPATEGEEDEAAVVTTDVETVEGAGEGTSGVGRNAIAVLGSAWADGDPSR
mmetsp:Transcript_22686/g.73804  ORF Transcript_22686/g.73804 Transcript_22686/m.73804 type:complete len:267 (+) Transcript_22686:2874-3674(+)